MASTDRNRRRILGLPPGADDGASWGECVSMLLGPLLPSDDPLRRKRDALQLAAAALRAAGAADLARQAESRHEP